MNLTVLGMGYIGLPTACVIASSGIKVTGIDINEEIIHSLSDGKLHFEEPKLEKLFLEISEKGLINFATEPQESDFFMIAVPTPITNENLPDCSYIESATKSIAPLLKKGDVVILESTSPVGTTEMISKALSNIRNDLSFPEFGGNKAYDVAIAYCPERVLPGAIVKELFENNRTVGGMTQKCSEMAANLYKSFVKGEIVLTDCRTAELNKLVENSYRDVNIAFANELSIICDELGINVWDLIEISNKHPRVDILQPGPGVGGHCIAVDPWFIVSSSPENSNLIRKAREVNDSKPTFVLEKVQKAILSLGKDISEIKIGCLGLSFKANVDDLRESPALQIALEIEGILPKSLYIVEPNIVDIPSQFNSEITELTNEDYMIEESDIIILLVDHKEFYAIKPEDLKNKLVIDTKGIWQ